MNLRSAVSKVNKNGMLLVFPINNRREPKSLWYEFFPKSEMRWEWDSSGDNRVAELWHLRERLSTSRQVVYTKWFRGRATLISFELFKAMVRILYPLSGGENNLTHQARDVIDFLNEDSPLSTKALKRATDLQGRDMEKYYNAALKELWSRMAVVGFGEVDEGAFPSLAIGASRVIFDDLWEEAHGHSEEEAQETIDRYLEKGTPFRKFFDELVKKYMKAAEFDPMPS